MCLLSVYSPGAMVNLDHLRNGAACNPDGYGYAIVAGDRIETGHGMIASAVIEAFDRARQLHPESWALFHSRYTTDGSTTVDNCHPFVVGGDARTVLAHNGVLPRAASPRGQDKRSDTRILAEDLIPAGMFGKLNRSRGRRSLTKWILSEQYPNKIAILTVDPRYRENAFILNESAGEWVAGVWHSNTGYLTPRRSRYLTAWDWTSGGSREIYADHASEVAGAYDDWVLGRITYAEYLDVMYTGDRPGNCGVCGTGGSVNQAYGYCTFCKHCADCAADLDACDCWSPSSVDTIRAALNDGPPMALEAATGTRRPVADLPGPDIRYEAVVAARALEQQADAILSADDDSAGREHC